MTNKASRYRVTRLVKFYPQDKNRIQQLLWAHQVTNSRQTVKKETCLFFFSALRASLRKASLSGDVALRATIVSLLSCG